MTKDITLKNEIIINFTTEKRKLSELIPWEENPRILDKKGYKELKASMDQFGWPSLITINLDNRVCSGHQRLEIAKKKYGKDYEVEVRVPERLMTLEEFKRCNIISNINNGGWNYNILANNYDALELKELGLDIPDIEMVNAKKVDQSESDHGGEKIILNYSQEDFDLINSMIDNYDLSKEVLFKEAVLNHHRNQRIKDASQRY